MSIPQSGDIVIRGTTDDGYEIVEAFTDKRIGGHFQTVAVALAFACAHRRRRHYLATERG